MNKYKKNKKKESQKESELNIQACRAQKQKYQNTIISSFYPCRQDDVYDIIQNYPIASQSLCFLLEFVKVQNESITRNLSLPLNQTL